MKKSPNTIPDSALEAFATVIDNGFKISDRLHEMYSSYRYIILSALGLPVNKKELHEERKHIQRHGLVL